MAPSKERLKSDSSDQKAIFKCCKKKSAAVVCVNCGNVFHRSCVTRDWADKVHFIDETRVICCKADLEVSNEIAAKIEITYLKRLLTELEKQNKTLEENGNLWKERYETLKTSLHNPSIISRIPGTPTPPSPRLPIPDDAKAKDVADDSVGTDDDSAVPMQDNGKGEENPLDGASQKSAIFNGKILNSKNPSSSDAPPIDDRSNGTDDIDSHEQQRESAKNFVNTQNQNTENQEIWETQKRRGFKQKTSPQSNGVKIDIPKTTKIARPQPLKGNNENVPFLKTAPRMAFLFLSGLAAEVKSEEILEYLKQNGLEKGCSCEKIHTKKSKYRSSFKLAVPHHSRDKYMTPTLWPNGVIINHFLNLQSRKMTLRKL